MSTIRESIQAAMEQTKEEPDVTPAVDAASEEAPALEEQPAEPTAAEEAPTASSRARDEGGRFSKKAPESAQAPETKAKPPPVPKLTAGAPPAPTSTSLAPAEPAVQHKAPASWSPKAREVWAKLPPEVHAEVSRRETEVAGLVQGAAVAKRFAQEFGEVVKPHLATIQAEGGDVMRTVGNLFQTYGALRSAPPEQKAALVANMVKSFGVDVAMLDTALAGHAAAPGGGTQPVAATGQYRDPRVDQLFAGLEQAKQQRAASSQAAVLSEIEAFASKHEFFEDVRNDVADMMEMAARRGQPLTLEAAYERALKLHPEISGVLAQREAAKKVADAKASAARARAAGSSVRSSPAPTVGDEARPKTIRDSINASLAALSNR